MFPKSLKDKEFVRNKVNFKTHKTRSVNEFNNRQHTAVFFLFFINIARGKLIQFQIVIFLSSE